MSTLLRCPDCRSLQVRLSRTKGGRDRLVKELLLLRPYRCTCCGSRFFHKRVTFRKKLRLRSVQLASIIVVVLVSLVAADVVSLFPPSSTPSITSRSLPEASARAPRMYVTAP